MKGVNIQNNNYTDMVDICCTDSRMSRLQSRTFTAVVYFEIIIQFYRNVIDFRASIWLNGRSFSKPSNSPWLQLLIWENELLFPRQI